MRTLVSSIKRTYSCSLREKIIRTLSIKCINSNILQIIFHYWLSFYVLFVLDFRNWWYDQCKTWYGIFLPAGAKLLLEGSTGHPMWAQGFRLHHLRTRWVNTFILNYRIFTNPYISRVDLFTEVRGELALFEGEEVDGSEDDHDDPADTSVDSEDDFRPCSKKDVRVMTTSQTHPKILRMIFVPAIASGRFCGLCNSPWVFISIPPKTAPQKRPKPWWTPWTHL